MKLSHILIILISFVLLCSCLRKNEDSIKIGLLDGPSAISFIHMLENPPVIAGKQVEFIIKSEPLQIQAMMMQYELDFAVLPTVMAANLYNKGINYRVIAIPIWGTLYLVSNNSSIQQFKDLNQQKVHVFGRGTSADILLQHYLQKMKVEDVGIDYSYQSNRELSFALLHKKIHTAVISEPQSSILLSKDSTMHIVSEINCEDYNMDFDENAFAQTSFLVNNKITADYSTNIKLVASYYAASCNFVSQQTEKAAELLVKHGYYPEIKTAMLSIPLSRIKYQSATEVPNQLYRFLNIFYTFDPASIGGKLPDEHFIYPLD